MTPVLIDSNILLDIFEDDVQWADWAESTLNHYAESHTLSINPITGSSRHLAYIVVGR